MEFIEILTYVMMVIALLGSYLNAKRRREGFLLWMLTNGFWIIHNLSVAEYAQAILYSANMVIAIMGFVNWKKNPNDDVRNKQ